MPMSFPDMKSLKFTADIHNFRQPLEGESEDDFRLALAGYVINIDKIESYEIKFGVGWDQWTDEQKKESIFG